MKLEDMSVCCRDCKKDLYIIEYIIEMKTIYVGAIYVGSVLKNTLPPDFVEGVSTTFHTQHCMRLGA